MEEYLSNLQKEILNERRKSFIRKLFKDIRKAACRAF